MKILKKKNYSIDDERETTEKERNKDREKGTDNVKKRKDRRIKMGKKLQ